MRINDFDYHSLARAQVPSFVLETGTIGIAHVDGLDTAAEHVIGRFGRDFTPIPGPNRFSRGQVCPWLDRPIQKSVFLKDNLEPTGFDVDFARKTPIIPTISNCDHRPDRCNVGIVKMVTEPTDRPIPRPIYVLGQLC
jgi:hypothetical protein